MGGPITFSRWAFGVLQQGTQSFKLSRGQDQFVGDALHVRGVRIRIRLYCWLFGHGSSHESSSASHFTSMSSLAKAPTWYLARAEIAVNGGS